MATTTAPTHIEQPAQSVRASSSMKLVQVVGWLVLLIVPLCFHFSMDWEALKISDSVSQCLTLLLCAVIMWVFRLLPDFVPSVFLMVGLLSMGVAPPEIVFSGYSSQAFFLALSVLSLSNVITSSGLSQRILSFVVYKWRPKNKYMFSSIIFTFGLLTTPFIPSTNGRASLIAPFLNDALEHIAQNSREHQRLAVALLGGISLLSPMFLSAKAINLLLWGMLSTQDQYSFNFTFWFIAALVPGMILIVLFIIAQALVFYNQKHIPINHELLESQRHNVTKMNNQEIVGVIAVVSFIFLILTYSYHHIEIHLIAFILFFSFLFFKVINRTQLSTFTDWGFLIFLGGMIGFTNVLQFLQLNDLIATSFAWLLQYIDTDIHLFILLLSALVFVFRLFISINATVILLAGALLPATAVYGGSAWLVGFVILMMSESFIWPYQASYYMQSIAVLGSRHWDVFHSHRVYAINGLIFLLKLATIYLSLPYWKFLGVL